MKKSCAIVIGMWHWKRPWFGRFIQEYSPVYLDEDADLNTVRQAAEKNCAKGFIIWGFSEPLGTLEYAELNHIAVWRVEDGFLRSTGLTGHCTPALSLCFDSRGLYFNALIPSDLEELLNRYDFSGQPELLTEARACRSKMLSLNLSKYNYVSPADINTVYGPKKRRRILVVGQVEDDMSIRYGYGHPFNNNDLVRLAHREKPDAQIIYKPHPDVLEGHREPRSNPNEVANFATLVTRPLHISSALQTIDQVYTLTSLVGFESLMRGIPVTVIGQPFYAGWGLTDDRAEHLRRRRALSVDELFAGAYLLYPRYVHPQTQVPISADEAIDLLASGRV